LFFGYGLPRFDEQGNRSAAAHLFTKASEARTDLLKSTIQPIYFANGDLQDCEPQRNLRLDSKKKYEKPRKPMTILAFFQPLYGTARQAKKSARGSPCFEHALDGKNCEPLRFFLELIKQTQLYAKNNPRYVVEMWATYFNTYPNVPCRINLSVLDFKHYATYKSFTRFLNADT